MKIRKNQEGMAHLGIALLVVVLLIVGTGVYVYQHRSKSVNSTSENSTELSLTDTLPTDILTVEQIKDVATKADPGATVSTVELDTENGMFVYKVKMSDDKHLFFDAQTGAAVTNVESDDESGDGDLPKSTNVTVTFDQARAIALTKKPDCTIDKIKLNGEDGKPFYKVTCSDGAKIFINAVTGDVTKLRVEGKNKSNTPGADKGKNSSSDDSDNDSGDDDNSGSDDRSGSDSGSGSHSGSDSSGGGDSGSDSGGSD